MESGGRWREAETFERGKRYEGSCHCWRGAWGKLDVLDDAGGHIFCHSSDLPRMAVDQGLRPSLAKGARVTFEVEFQEQNRVKAVHVQVASCV